MPIKDRALLWAMRGDSGDMHEDSAEQEGHPIHLPVAQKCHFFETCVVPWAVPFNIERLQETRSHSIGVTSSSDDWSTRESRKVVVGKTQVYTESPEEGEHRAGGLGLSIVSLPGQPGLGRQNTCWVPRRARVLSLVRRYSRQKAMEHHLPLDPWPQDQSQEEPQ